MSKRILVPEARGALNKLKEEYANELGVNLNHDEDKGDNASKLNGYFGGPIGGLMTKKMVEQFERDIVDR